VEIDLHSPIRLHGVMISLKMHRNNFTFTTSRPDLGPTQPSIQQVPGVLSPKVKLPGREADHSHLHLVSRLRISGTIPPLPQYVFNVWYLVKYRDKFTLLLLLPCAGLFGNQSINLIVRQILLGCENNETSVFIHRLP